MSEELRFAGELIEFIHRSPTEFHVVANCQAMLAGAGFVPLDPGAEWKIVPGGKYRVSFDGSALVAFIAGEAPVAGAGFRILEGHTDSPTIRIKPNPEMVVEDHYLKLNAEVYGSAILNTWFDRPLSLAGRASLRSGDPYAPKDVLVHINEPLLYIPNLSIHHNKDVNTGVAINQQRDLTPLMAVVGRGFERRNFLLSLVAERLGVGVDDILGCDLSLCEHEPGCVVGANREFISSTRLDNQCLAHSAVRALAAASPGESTGLVCLFDSEEVGNRGRQAAESPMLASVLERIVLASGGGRSDYFRAVHASFMVSADMSQGLHPNAPEKSDPVTKVRLNGGPVVKYSGAKKFTSDSASIAVFAELCRKAEVPLQQYMNRSDSPGGSTAGPASLTQVALRSVDVGIPLLAMHSIRELGGVRDNHAMYRVFATLFA